jgi:hypothetical protein
MTDYATSPFGAKIDFNEMATQTGAGIVVVNSSGVVEFKAIGSAGKGLIVNSSGDGWAYSSIGNYAGGLGAGSVTQTNFTTDATNLTNIFDENFSTAAGQASKTGGASNNQQYAYFKIDLGASDVRTSLRTKYDTTRGDNQGGNGVGIQISLNDTDWTTIKSVDGGNIDASYSVDSFPASLWKFRYVRFVVGVNSSTGANTTTTLTLYEIIVT